MSTISERRTHLDATAIGLLIGCCFVWGFQQVLIKLTLPAMAPVFQASLRMVVGALCLLIWCRLRGIALWQRDGSLWPGLMAGTLFAFEFVCIYIGLIDTSASRLTIFLYTSPFWVAVCVPLRIRSERLNLLQWVGLCLAFGSVGLALQEGWNVQTDHPYQWRGDLLGVLAGALWGLTTLTLRTTRLVHVGAEKMLIYQLGGSALILPLVSLALGETWNWSAPSWAWASIAAQSVLGAFVTILIWMWLMARYPVTRITSFSFLSPIFGLLIAHLWLGEAWTVRLGVAIFGVAVGIVLVNRPK
ncbi:MAG: DMT family transporter [Betaproteobacteria bacterium]